MMDVRNNIVILNRWRGDYALYERYIDHSLHNVLYICDESSADGISVLKSDLVIISSTADLDNARMAVQKLSIKWGAPTFIVALYEDDQLVAAHLREEYRCRGPLPREVIPFRDKLIMLKTARDYGLNVPPFAEIKSLWDLERFIENHGYPVLVKPRLESSSAGVTKVNNAHDIPLAFTNAEGLVGESLIAQVFVSASIVHIDGVFSNGEVACFKASDYLGTCLNFREASAILGSVERTTDHADHKKVKDFAKSVMQALSLGGATSVFHMELFEPSDTESDYALLEVGARVGGGMIPYIWRELHGLDLMELAWNIAIANPSAGIDFQYKLDQCDGGSMPVGGWLLIQNSIRPPCRVESVKSMVDEVDGPYAELLPAVGSEVPFAHTFFEHVAARFRFQGASSEEVRKKLMKTSRDFRISVIPA